MRKIIPILLVAVVSAAAFSFSFTGDETQPEKIKWYTFLEAVELNKKTKKKIFIDVYTEWCHWCKVMDKNTFTHPVVIKYMNEKYYCVKLDAEMKDTIVFNNHTFVNPNPNIKRSTHQLAASMLDNKLGYPSFVFFDENFGRLFYVQSYLTPSQFEPYIKFVGENSYLTVKWEEFNKIFKPEIPPPPPPAPPVIPQTH